jgi:hypothetical protein
LIAVDPVFAIVRCATKPPVHESGLYDTRHAVPPLGAAEVVTAFVADAAETLPAASRALTKKS